MIRRRHSTVVRVPTPAEYCSSLLSQKDCFVVFHDRLKGYVSERSEELSSEQANWVLKRYEWLKSRYSEWENEAEKIDRSTVAICTFSKKCMTVGMQRRTISSKYKKSTTCATWI